MLHTVNKSPFGHSALDECISMAADGATILLIEDGVYAAKAGASYEGKLKAAMGNVKVAALGPDLAARGITACIEGVTVVDYDGFVELVAENKMTAWV
ncbi:MAG: sulfurtransferase complex subunit TusB [Nitrospinae bacterium]|nr:sulfurtransferase complex subunit TusB [Nitrospinota bacterium]